MRSKDESAPSFPVGEDTRVKLTLKTLLGIIGAVAVGVAAWYSLKADVSLHATKLENIQVSISDDHDQLKVQGTLIQQQGLLLERMDRKLDNLAHRGSVGGSSFVGGAQ